MNTRDNNFNGLVIRSLLPDDTKIIAEAFTKIGWNKPATQYEEYYRQRETGVRLVLVALSDNNFAGYLTIHFQPEYLPFRSSGIPEIQDLNVLPEYRNRGIASKLLDEAAVKNIGIIGPNE